MVLIAFIACAWVVIVVVSVFGFISHRRHKKRQALVQAAAATGAFVPGQGAIKKLQLDNPYVTLSELESNYDDVSVDGESAV